MPIKDPMDRNARSSWAFLDDETCFNLWNTLGTARKAARELENRGVLNPDTGRPPTAAGVYIAALRYAAANIEEARQKIIDAGGDWAHDKLKHLVWIFERANKQSNLLGKRRLQKFNDDILPFAIDYLNPDEYETFLEYYRELVGEDCIEEDCEEAEPELA